MNEYYKVLEKFTTPRLLGALRAIILFKLLIVAQSLQHFPFDETRKRRFANLQFRFLCTYNLK